jgi:hypothetical protein
MWCPVPLPEGELHRTKLRSYKYLSPVGRLLEFYESDLSVEADKDTDVEAEGDAGTGPDAGGTALSRHRTRSVVGKKSASSAAAAVYVVKAAEKRKKRKRKATSPPVIVTLPILTPRSREVKSEDEEEDEAIEVPPVVGDRTTRRSKSPAAKRQRELIEKTSEDALRRGLEVQRTAATAQARMPTAIRPRLFRPKPRIRVTVR